MYLFYVCLLAPLIQNGFSLIGEETDLNSLSSYDAVDDLNENYEIWNTEENDDAGIVIFDNVSKQLLENICENSNTLVYITREDVTIDCKTFRGGDEPRNIAKRSADEDEVEGSGDNGESDANQEVITTTEETNAEPETEENKTGEKESEPKTGEEESESETGEKESEPETQAVDQVDGAETTPASETTVQEVDTETTVAEENNETTTTETTEETSAEQTEPETATESSDKENDENTEQISDKETEDNNINKDTEKKGKSLISPNENGERGTDDEPVKTDKSTESTKRAGSKDTTILITLFVAVVVVGAIAFAYNFIKKRKQQNADLERVERAPSIKRSLQNLTKVEGEAEKKPLIGDNKEVEMVEMKRENGESVKT